MILNVEDSYRDIIEFYQDEKFMNAIICNQRLYNKSNLMFKNIKRYANYLLKYKKSQIEQFERIVEFSCPYTHSLDFDLIKAFSLMPAPGFTYLTFYEEAKYITVSSFKSSIDFGTVGITGVDGIARHEFHIINKSIFNLTLKLKKEDDYDDIFEFSSALEMIIPANYESVLNFKINLNQQSYGLHKTHVYLYSDRIVQNNVEKPIDLELTANLEKLDIELSRERINFGNIMPNDIKTLRESFKAKNKTSLIIYVKAEIEIDSQLNAVLNKQDFCIMPNSEEEINVSIKPNYIFGLYKGSVILKLNSSQIKKVVELEANMEEPRISVKDERNQEMGNNSSLSFGDTEIDDKLSISLRIDNVSSTRVFVQASIDKKVEFKLSKTMLAVHPGKSCNLTISFKPISNGEKTAQLQLIYSNHKKYSINLKAKVGSKEIAKINQPIKVEFHGINDLKRFFNEGYFCISNLPTLYGNNQIGTQFKIKDTETVRGTEFRYFKSFDKCPLPNIIYKPLTIRSEINDKITIINDSKVQPYFDIPLKISIKKPNMVLSPIGSVNFGVVKKGSEKGSKFEVLNSGQERLEYSIIIDSLSTNSYLESFEVYDQHGSKLSNNNLDSKFFLNPSMQHTYNVKIKVRAKAGVFFHNICIESEKDPYYAASRTLVTKKRYLTCYGVISASDGESNTNDVNFNWKSCNLGIILENCLTKNNELIFATWPSLVLAMILDSKTSFLLPNNEDDYFNILIKYSNENEKPDIEKLKEEIEKIKQENEKNDNISNIKKFFKFSKVLINAENSHIYDCFYYFFTSLMENKVNNLFCILANTLQKADFDLTSLHKFSKKLDSQLLCCNIETNSQNLTLLFDLLRNSDIMLDFNFNKFINFLKFGLTCKQDQELESKLIEFLRNDEVFESIYKFIEESNVERLFPIMKEKIKNLYTNMNKKEMDQSLQLLIEVLPNDIHKKKIESFYGELATIFNSRQSKVAAQSAQRSFSLI